MLFWHRISRTGLRVSENDVRGVQNKTHEIVGLEEQLEHFCGLQGRMPRYSRHIGL